MFQRNLARIFFASLGVLALVTVLSELDIINGRDDHPPDDDDDSRGEGDVDVNLIDTLSQAGRFGTLCVALKQARLIDLFETEGPFTIFAPTDDAFAKLGPKLDELLAKPNRLRSILKFHAAEGRFAAADLADTQMVKSLAGEDLAIDSADGISVNGVAVTDPDLTATNGIIHGIDTILAPVSKGQKAKSDQKAEGGE